MRSRTTRGLFIASAVSSACAMVTPASAQAKYEIADVKLLAAGSGAGVSDDGSMIIGNANPVGVGSTHAMIWTQKTGKFLPLAGIERELRFQLDAHGLSGDGTVISGTASNAVFGEEFDGTARAYRYTAAGGFQDLGSLTPGWVSSGRGISADGNVVVGDSWDKAGRLRATRWTEATGMVSLGQMDDAETLATAHATSGDGAVIVGLSSANDASNVSRTRAFSWTEATGMTPLASLPGVDPTASGGSTAFDVSYDGRVIAGSSSLTSEPGSRQVAVRWVDGVVSALSETEHKSMALGVSGNGQVVVGETNPVAGFRWDETTGLITVEEWLRGSGVEINDGTTRTARATNCDGSVIVGDTLVWSVGAKPDLYIARGQGTGSTDCSDTADAGAGAGGTGDNPDDDAGESPDDDTGGNPDDDTGENPDDDTGAGDQTGNPDGGQTNPPAAGLITLTALNASLGGAAAANHGLVNAVGVLLNGVGSRPLDRRAPVGRNIVWANGDIGRNDHGARDGGLAVGEMGFGHNFGPVQINGTIGLNRLEQNTMLGGDSSAMVGYTKIEALGKLYATDIGGVWAVMTGTALWGQADITRNYVANGGLIDSSTGKADVRGFGIRGRLQWENLVQHFSPYAEASHSRSCLGSYTEAGGAFPATFKSQCNTATEARIGADVKVPLNDTFSIIGTVEAVHRFEEKNSNVSGTVLGLGAFNIAAAPNQQNWARAGLGLQADFGQAKMSVMGNLTSAGETPNAWLAVSLSSTF